MGLKRTLLSIMALVMFVSQASGEYSVHIDRIEIVGLSLVSKEVLDQHVTLAAGQSVDASAIQSLVKSLYQTQLFDQVKVSVDEGVLTITLMEQPVIERLEIESDLIPENSVRKELEKQGVVSGEMYREDVVLTLKQGLLSELKQQGFDHPEIEIVKESSGEQTIVLKIIVKEGGATKLHRIYFEGNKHFSDAVLRKQLRSRSTGPLSFIMQDDLFSRVLIEQDRQRLVNFYKQKGYHSPRISVTDQEVVPEQRVWKNHYQDVTFNIYSGPLFTIEKVNFSDNIPKDCQQLFNDALLNQVANCDAKTRVESILRDYYADEPGSEFYTFSFEHLLLGYDSLALSVKLSKDIDQVRYIYFQGNIQTKDEPLRRALSVEEAKPFNIALIKKSEQALRNLGYLKSANIETIEVEPNVYDLAVTVKEASSQNINGGASWAGWDNAALDLSASDKNFLGYGNSIDFSANIGMKKQQASVSFSHPNVTVSGHSYSLGASFSRQSKDSEQTKRYYFDTYSLAGNYAIPVSNFVRFTTGLGYIHHSYYDIEEASSLVRSYFADRENQQVNQYRVSNSLSYVDLDNAYRPSKGIAASLNSLVTLPFADGIAFYDLNGTITGYRPLFKMFDQDIVMRLRLKGAIINDYQYDRDVPFFVRLTAGGLGSVRGYAIASLGPKYQDEIRQKDAEGHYSGMIIGTNERTKGGNKLLVMNMELQLPSFMPDLFTPYAFVDMGNVFDESESITLGELRGSVGVSAQVAVPFVGDMTFSLALPFNHTDKDQFSHFSLGMGRTF